MADSISSSSSTRPHNPSQDLQFSITQSKPTCKNRSSCSRILCKSLIFFIFLIAIPLFPSQAPNFINQTPFTKFWELLHLLFIGLAVCYGLFSCRRSTNFDVNRETESSTALDDSQSSYVSRIFHVSPIFEDGFENTRGFDEKNGYNSCNSWYHRGDHSMVTVAQDGFVVNEQSKSGSLYSENGLQNSFEHDENNAIEAFNSQYFRGESMIVVSQPNCAIDEYGENGHANGYKPLGLPVRSLNSRISDQYSPHLSNESESDISLNALSKSGSSEKSISEANFGNMGPINLEEKFNDTVAWPSKTPLGSASRKMEIRENGGSVAGGSSHLRPLSVDESQFDSLKSIPWGLTSRKMETRENGGSVASGSLHLRPLSVDESQFDSLKSRSFRSTTSFSSQTSSASYSPTRVSPSNSVASGLLPNSETEELGKNKSHRASYPPASQSPQTTLHNGSRLNAFHLRRYSSGSLFQKESKKSLKNELKNLGGNIRKDSLSSTEKEQGSLKLDKKSTAPVKGSSVGKSVRTIRAGAYTGEATKVGDAIKKHVEDPVSETFDEAKATKLQRNAISGRHDEMSIGTNKNSLDDIPHLPKSTSEKYKKDREEHSENVPVDRESKTDTFRMSSDEDALIDTNCQPGDDPNEVDKKAGEFIAKFREQIRLQKVESMDRSRRFRRARDYI